VLLIPVRVEDVRVALDNLPLDSATREELEELSVSYMRALACDMEACELHSGGNEAPALTGHEAAYQHSESSVPDHEDMPRESGSVLVDPRDMLNIHGFPTSIEEWEKNQQLIWPGHKALPERVDTGVVEERGPRTLHPHRGWLLVLRLGRRLRVAHHDE
jgi:hypothetical protein